MNKKLVLFGGRNKKANNDLYILNLDTKTWSRLLTISPPVARFGDCVISYRNKIFQFGGWVGYDKKKRIRLCKRSVYCLNLENRKWNKCVVASDVQPKHRRNAACAFVEREMFVYGGFDRTSKALNCFWSFNIKTYEWR
jgi:N-acetylneuraminic acid mutarotase